MNLNLCRCYLTMIRGYQSCAYGTTEQILPNKLVTGVSYTKRPKLSNDNIKIKAAYAKNRPLNSQESAFLNLTFNITICLF